jgi:hypothetical protein
MSTIYREDKLVFPTSMRELGNIATEERDSEQSEFFVLGKFLG